MPPYSYLRSPGQVPWGPHPVPRPLLGCSDQKGKSEPGPHPPHRPFLAPEELGVLPARVRGSQPGINSSTGGGDRDFHSQTLEVSCPRRAGQPLSREVSACCPPACPPGGLALALPPACSPSHMPGFPLSWVPLQPPVERGPSGVRVPVTGGWPEAGPQPGPGGEENREACDKLLPWHPAPRSCWPVPPPPDGFSVGLSPNTCPRWAQEGGEAASPAGRAEAWKGTRDSAAHAWMGFTATSQGQLGTWPRW